MMRSEYLLCAALSVAAAPVPVLAAAPAVERSPAWVAQRAAAWQPTAEERRWEGIGWAKDIRHALRLAKANNRPVFLFTLDGRMNVGRC